MSRRSACGLLATALLAACQAPVPPLTAVEPSVPPATPTPMATPTPHPGLPAAAASPLPSATPRALSLGVTPPRGQEPAAAVGQTLELLAIRPFDGVTVAGGVTWTLDAPSAARARIAKQEGGRCTLTITAPGAIRLAARAASGDGEILVAGVTDPAPGTLDPAYPEWARPPIQPIDGVFVIRSAVEWARYWEASRQRDMYAGAQVPPTPEVDWDQASVVLLAETSTGGQRPVLVAVEPAGVGRVVAVRPFVYTGAPVPSSQHTSLRVYRTAKLPATTVVEYTCDAAIGCPTGEPLPTPDPFASVEGRTLTVGQPFTLPAGWVGEPLTWTLGARTANRAELSGLTLRPLAPGALVLEARAGDRTAYVLHAIQPAQPVARPIQGPYFPSGVSGLQAPAVAHDQAAWERLWGTLWAPPGPLTSPNGEPTSPPPPPPAPAIDFNGRSVLVWRIDVQAHQQGQPVVTGVEGGTVQVVVPDARVPGRPDPYAPPSAAPGQPVPDFGPMRGLRPLILDLPRLPEGPTVEVDAFPEAGLVR